MKRIAFFHLLLVLMFASSNYGFAGQVRPIHHIVLVQMKPDVSAQGQQKMLDDTLSMLSQIPGVQQISVGKKVREDRAQHIKNYQIAIHVQLEKEADLDVYGAHPLHNNFIAKHKDKFVSYQVVDFVELGNSSGER